LDVGKARVAHTFSIYAVPIGVVIAIRGRVTSHESGVESSAFLKPPREAGLANAAS
jgi:hypothetical protein